MSIKKLPNKFKNFINGCESDFVEINVNEGELISSYNRTKHGYSFFSEDILIDIIDNYLLHDLSNIVREFLVMDKDKIKYNLKKNTPIYYSIITIDEEYYVKLFDQQNWHYYFICWILFNRCPQTSLIVSQTSLIVSQTSLIVSQSLEGKISMELVKNISLVDKILCGINLSSRCKYNYGISSINKIINGIILIVSYLLMMFLVFVYCSFEFGLIISTKNIKMIIITKLAAIFIKLMLNHYVFKDMVIAFYFYVAEIITDIPLCMLTAKPFTFVIGSLIANVSIGVMEMVESQCTNESVFEKNLPLVCLSVVSGLVIYGIISVLMSLLGLSYNIELGLCFVTGMLFIFFSIYNYFSPNI